MKKNENIKEILYRLDIEYCIDKQPTIHGTISGEVEITLKNEKILTSEICWDDFVSLTEDFSNEVDDYDVFLNTLNDKLVDVIEKFHQNKSLEGVIKV